MLKLSCIILSIFLSFVIFRCSWAQKAPEGTQLDQAQATVATEQKQKAVDVGNQICPVSGEEINPQIKATYEYQGKIYNFCCAGCIKDFKKDPQKYIKKVEEELKAKAKSQKNSNKDTHDMHNMPMP